jgi:hypothetical protein
MRDPFGKGWQAASRQDAGSIHVAEGVSIRLGGFRHAGR